MFKRLLTIHALDGAPFFMRGSQSMAKIMLRTLTQTSTKTEEIIETDEKWDLISSVCIERHPIITKPMSEIEERYQKMLNEVEYENSMLSEFEVKQKQEAAQKNQKSSKRSDSENIESLQDFRDASEKELKAFKFAPRVNEDKKDEEVISLRRKLDKTLVLLVEQQIGDKKIWIPPQSIRKNTETMIQTAQRTLRELVGDGIKVQFYGNAPIGFHQYKYPLNMRNERREGAKIFFFLGKYISGNVSSKVKYCWLDRNELKETLNPSIYKNMSKFLISD